MELCLIVGSYPIRLHLLDKISKVWFSVFDGRGEQK